MVTVDTVEDFWRAYVYLRRPTSIEGDVNLYMFRNQLSPVWEDYPFGGCWILKFRKGKSDLGRVWQDVLLALVGEALGDTDVVGCSLALRAREDLISIWNRDNRDETRRFRIVQQLKSCLSLASTATIEYKYHVRSLMDKVRESPFRTLVSPRMCRQLIPDPSLPGRARLQMPSRLCSSEARLEGAQVPLRVRQEQRQALRHGDVERLVAAAAEARDVAVLHRVEATVEGQEHLVGVVGEHESVQPELRVNW